MLVEYTKGRGKDRVVGFHFGSRVSFRKKGRRGLYPVTPLS